MIAHRLAPLAPPAAALILATGCSVSVGQEKTVTGTGSAQTVAPADVTSQAEELIGPKMPDGSTLDCPGQLAAEVDARTTCTWSMPDGSSIGMTVTVTEVTDGKASLNFKNDDQSTPSQSS